MNRIADGVRLKSVLGEMIIVNMILPHVHTMLSSDMCKFWDGLVLSLEIILYIF